MKHYLHLLILCALLSCKESNKSSLEPSSLTDLTRMDCGITYFDTLDNPRSFPQYLSNDFFNKTFDRYLLIKGPYLKSATQKIIDYSELNGEVSVDYTYGFSELENWTVVKIPSEHDYYTFHNIVYWVLGYGEDDPNYASESIAISINKSNNDSYIIFNDYSLREKFEVLDVLFSVTNKNNKQLINIPFDIIVSDEEDLIPDYLDVLKKFEIQIQEIESLLYKEEKIKFAE